MHECMSWILYSRNYFRVNSNSTPCSSPQLAVAMTTEWLSLPTVQRSSTIPYVHTLSVRYDTSMSGYGYWYCHAVAPSSFHGRFVEEALVSGTMYVPYDILGTPL